jgi:hypothetical protein
MCFTISYPLSIHLKNKGIINSIENSIRFGRVGVDEIPHYWVSLENGFSIDPTARQFKSGLDLDYVHFGEALAKKVAYDFESIYTKWSTPLINGWYDLPNQDKLQIPPIEPYIKIGIKASIILLKDNNLDEYNMKYLDCICQASKRLYGENLDNELPNLDNIEIFRQFCINKNPL